MERAKRLELSSQVTEAADRARESEASGGADAQGTAQAESEASGEPAADVSGYEPNAVFELLPPLDDAEYLDDLDPELREFVRNWPNLDRDIKLIILGLARPWRGDGA
ncbi:MAG: hypothetical protein ABSF76_14190 [Opitutaceae bacterium]|jgi:hypothetical protein